MYNKNIQKQYPPHNSSIRNFSANWLSAGLYLATFILGTGRFLQFSFFYIAWAIPLAIFFMEKNSGLVRFHAVQATLLYFFLAVVYCAADLIGGFGNYAFFFRVPGLRRALSGLLLRLPALLAAAYGSYLSIRTALKWSELHLPVIGSLAARLNSMR